MPKLEYFLVAESISIDRDRNQVSVFNILEEVDVPFPEWGPAVIPQLVALSSWILQPEDQGQDFQVGLELSRPGRGDSQTAKYSLNFTAKGTRQRAHLRFTAIPVERDGDMVFNLTLNGEHKATHILTVRPVVQEAD